MLLHIAAASRVFKPDAQPRKGLSTGDVVALRMQARLRQQLADRDFARILPDAMHHIARMRMLLNSSTESKAPGALHSALRSLCTACIFAPCRAQSGALLAVSELGGDPSDTSVVHFAFQPREGAEPSDKMTHLEVIRQVALMGRQQAQWLTWVHAGNWRARLLPYVPARTCPVVQGSPGIAHPPPLRPASQGKWLGLRSAAAGDRFLQARKRSTPSRLVFFSQNVGTWEQWELGSAGPDPDAAEWASLPVTLRHRRLPQFELAVELVRVGAVALPPNAAVTPRSLLLGAAGEQGAGGGAAAAGAGLEEDPGMERRELQRMSGVLVHVRRVLAGKAVGVPGRPSLG